MKHYVKVFTATPEPVVFSPEDMERKALLLKLKKELWYKKHIVEKTIVYVKCFGREVEITAENDKLFPADEFKRETKKIKVRID